MTDAGADSGGFDAGPTDGGGDVDAGPVADGGPGDGGEVDGGPTASGLHITSLDSTGCVTIDHLATTGDDRGGIAVSGTNVVLSGDGSSAVYDLPLMAGAAIVPPGGLDSSSRDVMVSDVGSGKIYLLAGAAGTLGLPGDTRVATSVTRLIPMARDGKPEATGILTLSTPIALDSTSDIGLFAGRGQIGIHDGTTLFVIDTATSAVTNAGAVVLPAPQTCESWAYWGLLERAGATNSLVFAAEDFPVTTIDRVAVPSGTVTTVATFTDLNDMCSIVASTSLSRWYWHHETTSELATTTTEALGYCDATYGLTGTDFTVTTLTGAGCSAIEVYPIVGDDRGGIAISSTEVYLAGDGGLGRWATDLTAPATSIYVVDGLVTNIATGDIYALATATELIADLGGVITRLVKLDSATGLPTTTVITLSTPLTVPDTDVGIFAGWNEFLLHDRTKVWQIALPSGTVTDLGAMASPSHNSCENWAYWGVAENVDGVYSLVAADSDDIVRYLVPTGTRTVLGAFTNLGGMCTFTLSAGANRWYFHHEYDSQFEPDTTAEETLGYCPAVFEHP